MKSYYQKIEEKNQQTQTQKEYFEQFKGKPFYIWNETEHAKEYDRTKALYGKPRCCFNHIIGLPQKHGQPMPLFDYEKIIYDKLMMEPTGDNRDKHVWIKKAAGLGITEYMLRHMAWLCLKDDELKDSQMVILTGPRVDLGTMLVKRLRGLFENESKPGVIFTEEKTVCTLGQNITVEAFPSHRGLHSARGLPNVSFCFFDEADFAGSPDEWQEAREVVERYIGKNSPWVVLCSTPSSPEGLFSTIEKEEPSPYHKIFLPYTVGLPKPGQKYSIYTEEEIAAARISPSWPREYCLEYQGVIGNIFNPVRIENMVQRGQELEQIRNGVVPYESIKALGVDPGYSSSKFAIVMSQITTQPGGIVEVVYAEEFEDADFNEMIAEIVSIYRNYRVDNVYIDGSQPELVKPLKRALGDNHIDDYLEYQHRLKAKHRNPAQYMRVVAVSFREEGREMLAHTRRLLDADVLACSQTWNKVVTGMRTAYGIEGMLQKKIGEYDDILDALMLSCKHFMLPPPSLSPSSSSVLQASSPPPPAPPVTIPIGSNSSGGIMGYKSRSWSNSGSSSGLSV